MAHVTLVVALATQRRHLPGCPDLVRQPVFSTAMFAETPRVQPAVHAWSAQHVRVARAEDVE